MNVILWLTGHFVTNTQNSATCQFYCSLCLFSNELSSNSYRPVRYWMQKNLFQCQDQQILFLGLFIWIHSYWRRFVPRSLWALWVQRPLGHLPPWNGHLHGKKCKTSMWLLLLARIQATDEMFRCVKIQHVSAELLAQHTGWVLWAVRLWLLWWPNCWNSSGLSAVCLPSHWPRQPVSDSTHTKSSHSTLSQNSRQLCA